MSSHGHGPSVKAITTILISTFILGFITGVILYLQGHTGNEGDGEIDTDTNLFVVLGHQYGGCARLGCSSYRITDDGKYTYIARGPAGGEKKFEDTLSDKQVAALTERLAEVDFNTLRNTKFTGVCPVDHDGIAHTYDIEYKGERFTFDSCAQDLDTYELFSMINDYFDIFDLTHGGIK